MAIFVNYRRKKANFRVNNPSPHFRQFRIHFIWRGLPLSISPFISKQQPFYFVLFLTHSAVAVCVRHMRHFNFCKYYSVYKNRALCIHLASRRNRHNRSSTQTRHCFHVCVCGCTLHHYTLTIKINIKIRVYATQFIELNLNVFYCWFASRFCVVNQLCCT